jgi:hypothetical protein
MTAQTIAPHTWTVVLGMPTVTLEVMHDADGARSTSGR